MATNTNHKLLSWPFLRGSLSVSLGDRVVSAVKNPGLSGMFYTPFSRLQDSRWSSTGLPLVVGANWWSNKNIHKINEAPSRDGGRFMCLTLQSWMYNIFRFFCSWFFEATRRHWSIAIFFQSAIRHNCSVSLIFIIIFWAASPRKERQGKGQSESAVYQPRIRYSSVINYWQRKGWT